MRKILLILTLTFAAPALAQEGLGSETEGAPKTKVEFFLATKGRMLVKQFHDIGKLVGLGQVEIKTLTLFEPGREAQRVRGLTAEVKQAGRLEREHSSFLDLEELENLANALAHMDKTAEQWRDNPPPEYTELMFSTKGDFLVGFYFKSGEIGFFVRSGRIGATSFYGKLTDLKKLKGLVDDSLQYLKTS